MNNLVFNQSQIYTYTSFDKIIDRIVIELSSYKNYSFLTVLRHCNGMVVANFAALTADGRQQHWIVFTFQVHPSAFGF